LLSAGYERAAEECRRKVRKIIQECRRVNTRYRDPGWDIVSCFAAAFAWLCLAPAEPHAALPHAALPPDRHAIRCANLRRTGTLRWKRAIVSTALAATSST
jgi:hypothetical protein